MVYIVKQEQHNTLCSTQNRSSEKKSARADAIPVGLRETFWQKWIFRCRRDALRYATRRVDTYMQTEFFEYTCASKHVYIGECECVRISAKVFVFNGKKMVLCEYVCFVYRARHMYVLGHIRIYARLRSSESLYVCCIASRHLWSNIHLLWLRDFARRHTCVELFLVSRLLLSLDDDGDKHSIGWLICMAVCIYKLGL